jgi:hypothetical protein
MIKIDGKKPARKSTLVTGKGVISQRLTTDDGNSTGYFGAAASSNSGGLTRRMWISDAPGGEPIAKKASVTGVEPKLSFTQNNPTNRSQVKLKPNRTYYLNHSQHEFTTKPTASSSMIRSCSIGGA